jgi:hypothetical protein
MNLKSICILPRSILAKPLDQREVRRLIAASPQSASFHVRDTFIVREIQEY